MMSNIVKGLIAKEEKCSCRGYNLDKLLQPSILTLLAKKRLHGYLIIQELEGKNLYHGEKADNTGIYRTLKSLEDKGMVTFDWELEQTGPAKKVYQITETGRECLANWIDTLKDYQNTISLLIREAEEVFS